MKKLLVLFSILIMLSLSVCLITANSFKLLSNEEHIIAKINTPVPLNKPINIDVVGNLDNCIRGESTSFKLYIENLDNNYEYETWIRVTVTGPTYMDSSMIYLTFEVDNSVPPIRGEFIFGAVADYSILISEYQVNFDIGYKESWSMNLWFSEYASAGDWNFNFEVLGDEVVLA